MLGLDNRLDAARTPQRSPRSLAAEWAAFLFWTLLLAPITVAPTWNTNRPTIHELERCPSPEHSRYSFAPSLGCQGSSDHRLGRGWQMVVELPEL